MMMRRSVVKVLLAMCGVLLCVAQPTDAAVLARDGQARCVVVVSADAIEAEQTAAKEFAAYLEIVTGARPVIQSEAGEGTNIYLGRSETVHGLLPGVDWDSLGTDGIVMKTVGDDLVLSGGRPRGTICAVYTFLQDVVGCRWYALDAAEVIPSKPTLEVDGLDIVYRPPFEFRQHYTEAVRDPLFAVKLRLNGREFCGSISDEYGGSVHQGGAHTLFRQFLKKDEHFEAHPEWYGYNSANKKREPRAICFTNTAAREQATKEVLAYLAANPGTKVVSVSCNDSNAGGALP